MSRSARPSATRPSPAQAGGEARRAAMGTALHGGGTPGHGRDAASRTVRLDTTGALAAATPTAGLLAAGLLAAGLAATAQAGPPPRWWNGGAPGATAPVPAPAPPQLSRRSHGGVDLAIEPAAEGGWDVWVDNPLFGPVEALVEPATANGIAPELLASPALPARVRIPAQRRVLATRLSTGAARPSAPALRLRAVAGDPSARPEDADYRFPLDSDRAEISQGWGGHFSHRTPEHRHALDLSAPEGTPVLAARGGVVMQVVSGAAAAQRGADGTRDAAGGNAVRILHADGSMALYGHLADAGLQVRPGQRVRRGEPIARVGDTGYSTGPHLHFAVQVNRGLRLETVPFRMSGPQGVLRLQEAP